MPKHILNNISVFSCLRCDGGLYVSGEKIKCINCGEIYSEKNGIPLFFENHEEKPGGVMEKIKTFYEETPFPNYEGMETSAGLIDKAERSIFARMLNEQIPFNTNILEIGCGTGQLSNYLGIANRHIFGIDSSLNSLRLAEDFRVRNGLENVGFYQMNLFRPAFKKESFHLVICNGVLHHTGDPLLGFKTIAKLVKRGGFILVGLYNRFGRIGTDARRHIFRYSGGRFMFLDPWLKDMGAKKADAWFKDQYQNPHESKHGMGELLNWFKESGFEFCYGIPSTRISEPFRATDFIFTPRDPGNIFGRGWAQFMSVFNGWKEGGLFVMIGKKK